MDLWRGGGAMNSLLIKLILTEIQCMKSKGAVSDEILNSSKSDVQ